MREALEGARQELLDVYKQVWEGWMGGWDGGGPQRVDASMLLLNHHSTTGCQQLARPHANSASPHPHHSFLPLPSNLMAPQVADLEAAAGEVVLLESRAEAAEGERDEALEQLRAATPRPQHSWGALLELVGEAGAGGRGARSSGGVWGRSWGVVSSLSCCPGGHRQSVVS